jgi:hypothetical protein
MIVTTCVALLCWFYKKRLEPLKCSLSIHIFGWAVLNFKKNSAYNKTLNFTTSNLQKKINEMDLTLSLQTNFTWTMAVLHKFIYIWTLNGMWQLHMHSCALDFEWPIMFKLGLYGLLMNYNMFVWKLNL